LALREQESVGVLAAFVLNGIVAEEAEGVKLILRAFSVPSGFFHLPRLHSFWSVRTP